MRGQGCLPGPPPRGPAQRPQQAFSMRHLQAQVSIARSPRQLHQGPLHPGQPPNYPAQQPCQRPFSVPHPGRSGLVASTASPPNPAVASAGPFGTSPPGQSGLSPARVRRKRRDALAVVQAARKVREAVLVALRLLFALPGASPAVRYDTVSPGWLARRPETSAARSDRLLSSVGTNIRLLALGAQAPRAPTLAGTSDQL